MNTRGLPLAAALALAGLLLPAAGRAQPRPESLLAELEQLDQGIARRSAELDWVDQRLRETAARIAETAAEVTRQEAAIAHQRANLKRRARVLYRLSREGLVGLLLGGDSLAEVRARYHYLTVLLDHDVETVASCRAAIAELDRQRAALASDEKALAELRRALAESQRAAEAQRTVKREFLRRVLARPGLRRQARRETRSATRELGRVVASAEPGPPGPAAAPPTFRRARGRMPCPTKGELGARFGTRRDDELDAEIRHPGIDLLAPAGTEVTAVHAGTVAFAGYFKAYGQLVILEHGQGFFTLYAHLDQARVAKGATVAAGTVLGGVGDTGSVDRPKLYFELRFRGRPINPLRWVRCGR